MKKFIFTVIKIILIVAFIAGGYGMARLGISNIRDMRELERTPQVQANAVLPGPVNVAGKASVLNETLTSPDQNKECVYYRYLVERWEEGTGDDEGSWETVKDVTRSVPFLLKDESGSVRINPSEAVNFDVKESHERESGDMRYTEYRIDPGDQVFTFGKAVDKGSYWQIDYGKQGQYSPIISEYGAQSTRSGMATWSLFQNWAAIFLLSMALVILFNMFKVHHTMIYLVVMSLFLLMGIAFFGVNMTMGDLKASVERYDNLKQETRGAIQDVLSRNNISWDEQWSSLNNVVSQNKNKLSSDEYKRVSALQINLQRAVRRIRNQRSRFPENLFVYGMGLKPLKDVPLNDSQTKQLEQTEDEFEYASLYPTASWIFAGIALIAGFIGTHVGFANIVKKRFMENLPTVKIPGVTYGLNEIKGKPSIPDDVDLLTGPLSEKPCIYYHYEIKEKDGDDNWDTVEEESRHVPFRCDDGEGSIKVNPNGADITSEHSMSKVRGDRKYIEKWIEPDDELYILGPTRVDEDTGTELEIGDTEEHEDDPYMITNRSESEHKTAKTRAGFWGLDIALNMGILLVMVLFGLYGAFSPITYFVSSASVLGFSFLFFIGFSYNDFIYVQQRTEKAWGNIEVSLKKRADLIPRLVDVVKGYIEHEREVLENLSEIRDQSASPSNLTPAIANELLQNEMTAMDDLSAISEEYPELKANENMKKLMDQMVEMENEVALMREGYNKAVERYNVRLRSFPDVVFANMFGFESKDFITVEMEVRENPQIDFET
ncbi:MAG: LemA family protein, partial [bacterium]